MGRIVFAGNTAWGMYNFRGKLMKRLLTLGHEVIVIVPYDEYIHELSLKSASNLNGNLNCSKELEHYAS